MRQTKTNISIPSILAILFLLAFAILSFNFKGMQQIALYVCVPSAVILSWIAFPKWNFSVCFKLLLGLYLWECFTAMGAENMEYAYNELKRLVACALMAFAFNQLAKKEKQIPWLYLVYVVFYLGMIYYANQNILTDSFDYTIDRMTDQILNANLVAYLTFFVTIILYIFPVFLHEDWQKSALRLLFLVSPFWSFAIAIFTGSRQVLVIQAPLLVVLFYCRYFIKRRPIAKVGSIIIGFVLLWYFLPKAIDIYESSRLETRMEIELDDEVRILHFHRALKIGMDNPLMGVGPGNYKRYTSNQLSFSHSSYLELLANNGFPGLIIYVYMFIYFIRTQWKRYKHTHDQLFLIFAIFGLFYAIDNAFYVMHIAPWLISFFILVDSHSQTYYRYFKKV